MITPAQPALAQSQARPNAIEVQFTSALDQVSVVNGKASLAPPATGAALKGQIVSPANDTARWVFQSAAGTPTSLPTGIYKATLRGDEPSFITASGARLDGEPK